MVTLPGYTPLKRVQITPRCEILAALRDADGVEVLLKCHRSDHPGGARAIAAREYEVLRSAAGPGLVQALALEHSAAGSVIVLARVQGSLLADWLEERALEPHEFVEIALQLAAALSRIHGARLIHRDLRPAGIAVDRGSLQAAILDCCHALPFGAGGRSGAELDDEPFEGSLVYIAPEQTGRMGRGIDFRSDLYSLGATLYHALTGCPPFDGEDALALIHAHMARVPVSPLERRPGLPPTLSRIVSKLLQKEPEDRYQTANALQRDLLECRQQLRRTGRIDDDFPLGTADAPFRPLFSKQLYGRDAEVGAVHAAYARASRGAAELVLLRGPAGVGKSVLVHELRRTVAETRGYLAAGKFDLYRRELPYAGFVAAFESLVQQLLTESEERWALWRERLRAALGNVAAALVELVPDLGLVLGDVPPVPPLGPRETQARLALAVERFVRGCASPEHPLVLVLDDLQWADSGSRYLLEDVLTRGDTTALLVIAAYRDTEVDASHPFVELLGRLQRSGVRPTSVELAPLVVGTICEMLSDALGRPPRAVNRLAALVARKTGGIPLLIQQFVLHVHGLGLLRFETPQGWSWDDAAIEGADIPEGAVGLMIAKIERLEPGPRALIEFASCVGDELEVATLAELRGEAAADLEPLLYTLAEQGLLAPSPVGFRFVHDRIREAAQALLGAEERISLHHRTGLLLLEKSGPDALRKRLFEIADHLNHARERLSEADRGRALAIDVRAGQQALAAGAVGSAQTYYDAGRALFRDGDWEREPQLAFDLFWGCAESAYQLRSFERSLQLLAGLEARPLRALQQGHVLARRISVVTAIAEGAAPGTCAEPVDLALGALRRFGVRWPKNPSPLRALFEVLRTERLLRGALDERLVPRDSPPDDAWMAPLVVLEASGPALLRHSMLLSCFQLRYSVWVLRRYGAGPISPGHLLAGYAALRVAVLRSARGVERFARAASEWMERRPHPIFNVRGEYCLNHFVLLWIAPRRQVLQGLHKVAEDAREAGDREYLLYATRQHADHAALGGEPLADVLREWELIRRGDSARSAASIAERFVRMYRLLHGEGAARAADWRGELAAAEELLGASHDLAINLFWTQWIQVLCILQQYDAACVLAERIGAVIFTQGSAGPCVADFTLLRGLAAAAAQPSRASERRRLARIAAGCLRQLRKWARHGPDFAHMVLWLEAECAWIQGKPRQALNLYPKAVRRAREQGYLQHVALIHERRAALLLSERRVREGAVALSDAHAAYAEWGADAKLRELAERLAALSAGR